MSRSGYSDDYDDEGRGGLWRGAVASALKGKRGQAALRELLVALDAMPAKELASESLVTEEGAFCTLGVLGHARGIDMTPIDPEDYDAVAKAFGIAPAAVREIVYLNDEYTSDTKWVEFEITGPVRPYWPDYGRHVRGVSMPDLEARAKRWAYMRAWVAKQIVPGATS